MIPHARAELQALADHSALAQQTKTSGWQLHTWTLTTEDVTRMIAAYQAILAVDFDAEIDQLLDDMGVDPLGPPATTVQHAKVMRADAIELAAAATALALDAATLETLHMPNVPKMATQKSDSGIDVVGVTLNPLATDDIGPDEQLLLVSVKHTISGQASGMRAKLEKSVKDDLSGPYLFRQLTAIHGRLLQSGTADPVAKRIFLFLRDTLKHDRVRIVCVGAALPPPHCNLPNQPANLALTDMPDAHFRMLLVPDLDTLHDRLVPSG